MRTLGYHELVVEQDLTRQSVPVHDAETESRGRIRPPVPVPIDGLLPADSPRFADVDAEHAKNLSSVDAELPPILVHQQTMRVVDGMHRLRAATLRGEKVIHVQFFDGSENDAFLLAVAANIQHGLPLTVTERRTAAARIIRTHPEMSDRSIASVAGLSAKTVASIRAGAEDVAPVSARVGRDGRIRPLNSADGRRLAGQLFAEQPGASLRKVARESGISVGTARDVRKRIKRGDDPTLPRHRRVPDAPAPARVAPPAPRRPVDVIDPGPILEQLRQDPSLRYSEAGRSLLRWLAQRATAGADWDAIVTQIPPHCAILIARLARGCALAWDEFAEALDHHVQDCVPDLASGASWVAPATAQVAPPRWATASAPRPPTRALRPMR